MTRDDRLFLAEIVNACDEIASTLQAIDKQTFLSDIVVLGFVLNRLTNHRRSGLQYLERYT